MRYVFLFLVAGLCLIACKKDNDIDTSKRLSGVWVETTLRFDTMDFSYMDLIDRTGDGLLVVFRSKPYTDVTINPDYPVNHSSWYDYYFKDDKIFMRSTLSSSSLFGDYDFMMQSDQKAFTIKRFYGRKALPETIRFERLP
jgi:hypothetical protein